MGRRRRKGAAVGGVGAFDGGIFMILGRVFVDPVPGIPADHHMIAMLVMPDDVLSLIVGVHRSRGGDGPGIGRRAEGEHNRGEWDETRAGHDHCPPGSALFISLMRASTQMRDFSKAEESVAPVKLPSLLPIFWTFSRSVRCSAS